MKKDKKNKKREKGLGSLTTIGTNSKLTCGPDGCSLVGHAEWLKEKKQVDKHS